MAEQPDFLSGLRARWNELVGSQAPAAAPVVTSGNAQAAPRLPQAPVQQETSLLDQLRQRVQQDLSPGPLTSGERMGAFGRGVLSGRGSFLDNLSAGLAAQGQAEAARREEGRKAAELEATIAERDRRAQLEKAKFAEETTPGTLTGRLTEARIRQADAAAAQANRPQYQIVGTDERGNAVVVDMRDPTRTRTLEGVRPTRSEAAEATATRARIEAANRAGQTAVQTALRTGQVRENDQAGQERIYQDAFQRTLRSMEEARPAPGARGTQQPPAPTEGGAAGNVVNLPRL